ncbi:MAG TPA: carboxypeptidase regulatory-like domain-containing protein [Terriglobales bacterium]|nr:carboxypeptidase regulatory-like domain-containing protein [Terriglobales bacterium]
MRLSRCTGLLIGTVSLLAVVFLAPRLVAQTASGSIIGTVTDSTGAVVAGASVNVRSLSTGLTQTRTTTQSGTYSIVALEPGDYTVSVTSSGFQGAQANVHVLVGQTINGDFQLRPQGTTSEVEVQADVNQVNTIQATVQDATTSKEIDVLPLNGRNFLDLAQLSPGVQIQDGGNFDPTKNGFTGISVQGRSGRSTRIEVDGVDISDETVGTSTLNISEDSIQEFQVAQSTLDPATSLTSTGAVNVITRSGSNALHGSAFYLFRNDATAAKVGAVKAPFERDQVGVRVGGPVVKNKLFWFLNYEHTLQHGTVFTAPPAPFSSFGAVFPNPFHETEATARADWNISRSWQAFYSFHHDQFNVVTGYGGNVFQPYGNRNLTDVHTAGVDGTAGNFTHSFRFGYLTFRNYIGDARSQIPGLPQPFPGGQQAAIAIGSDPRCLFGVDILCLGPSWLAPQTTLQRNYQTRYDGSHLIGSHTLRYGADFIQTPQFTFGSFSGLGPFLNSNGNPSEIAAAETGPFSGGASNPLNYPLELLEVGNGLGYFSEKAALGFPHGGFHIHRTDFYFADFWKIKPNLSATLSLRYNRLGGRADSDLPPISALNALQPGLGNRVKQPNLDFAPQVGFAWDPFKKGKTSIRAGAGLFYDDVLLTVTLFDRTLRIPAGLGNSFLTSTGGVLPGTDVDITPLIGKPIGSVVDQAVAAQDAFMAAQGAATQNFNPNGTPGIIDPNAFLFNSFGGLLDPNYKTPYSTQVNVGVQQQLTRTLFLSVDYIHNTNVHNILVHDANIVGAVSTFNSGAAQAAMATTEGQFGCSSIDCAIGNGATINDFAANGLGSPASGLAQQFVVPNSGWAFPGRNANFGQMGIISTVGRSSYNALQIRARQNIERPVPGLRALNWDVSYNLSRFNAMSPDQDASLVNVADNVDLNRYYGPTNLDRTHMVTLSGTVQVRGGLQLSWLSRIYSALPATLTVPVTCSCPAEIFLTDLTGDGSGGDVLPGTNLGSFGHGVSPDNLNRVISGFNSNNAGKLTPAGQSLVNAGLFTPTQLQKLGAVVPSIAAAPAGQVGLDSFVADDVRVSWPFHVGRWERLSITPSVDVFNLFNVANFDPPNGLNTATLRGALSGTAGSLNGTTAAERTNRYGLGSGVFSQGIARALQFGLRVEF